MICLLISSKFQHLADTIKLTLQYATLYSPEEESKAGRKIKTSTIKWMSTETDTVKYIFLLSINCVMLYPIRF